MFESALAMLRASGDGDRWNLTGAINFVAIAYSDAGRAGEAEALYREALARREAETPINPAKLALAISNVAAVVDQQGRSIEAEKLLRRAVALIGEPPGDPSLSGTAYLNLGGNLMAQARYPEAEAWTRRALEQLEQVSRVDAATAQSQLAIIYYQTDRFVEAEAAARASVASTEAELPEGHPDVAQAYLDFAGLLDALGRYQDSERWLRDAQTIATRALPPDHPLLAAIYSKLGLQLSRQGRLADAEPYTRMAVAIYERVHKGDHAIVADALSVRASILHQLGRSSEAETIYRAVLAMHERLTPTDNIQLCQALQALGTVLTDTGKLDEAEAVFRRAVTIAERIVPASQALADTYARFAELLWRQQRLDEEEAVRRKIHAIRLTHAADHPDRITATWSVAYILVRQGRYTAETRSLYAQAADGVARRLLSYRSFTPSAQAELRGYRPLYLGRVYTARVLAQTPP